MDNSASFGNTSVNTDNADISGTLSGSDMNHDNTKRRSSSRSIKRRRFDDEIVEYSLGIPGASAVKGATGGRVRTQSLSTVGVSVGGTHSTHIHDSIHSTSSLLSSPTVISTIAVGTVHNTTSTSTPSPGVGVGAGVLLSGVGVSGSITQTTSATTGGAVGIIATPPTSNNIPPQQSVVHSEVKKKHHHYPMKHSTTVHGHGVHGGAAPSSTRNKKKGRQHNHLTTKDLGRWKPMDDLALIIGVQQTNDLKTVHLGTKFSCRFTVQELQQRWYALLYDEAVSRVAVAAMRSLHPDTVAIVQDNALWSEPEEKLLCSIPSQSNPVIETFEELLSKHSDVFYPQRSAKSLHQHWCTLRQYHLLPDQSLTPLPNNNSTNISSNNNSTTLGTLITPQSALENGIATNFNDAEDAIINSELSLETNADEEVETNVALTQRKNIMEIRQLENELGRWHVLVDSVTGYSPPDFDSHTLAVLRGRLVRYLMRSREITIGRSAKGYEVDVDLSLEGPAWKISRRQGTLRLRNTGEFFLSSEGKRPIFVDGVPILQGNKVRLFNNSVVEISCLRFIFTVNMDLIRIIRNEAIRLGLPP